MSAYQLPGKWLMRRSGGNPMISKKKRRKSGYSTPALVISKKNLVKHDLFVDAVYDEWTNYRDGFRDWFRDWKKIKNIPRNKCGGFPGWVGKRIRMNKKQKKLLKRRCARKMNN
jgi:hypothetical protein